MLDSTKEEVLRYAQSLDGCFSREINKEVLDIIDSNDGYVVRVFKTIKYFDTDMKFIILSVWILYFVALYFII